VNQLFELDKQLFYQINTLGTNPILDQVMPIITDLHKHLWFIAGLLPLIIAIWIFREKMKAGKIILLIVLSVALSDAVSYRLVKPMIDRERPDKSGITVQMRTNPHSGKSFPSNHAANNFAAATILAAAYPTAQIAFFGLAFIIAFSRVYVGVHFPLDVIGGALIGIFIAYTIWTLFGFRFVVGKKKEKPRIIRDAMTAPRKRNRWDRG
jgi:undecaprenyl-diphosphatase